MAGNYDVMQEQARKRFLTYDLNKVRRRLAIPETQEGIRIRFLSEVYLVCASDGEVRDQLGNKAAFNTAMSIYDVLCHSDIPPRLSGSFVPTMELHGIMGSNSVHENLNQRDAQLFEGRTEALTDACRRLGGVKGKMGDICYRLPVFDFFPVELRYWSADEEFPAQIQFFWDANALDFVYYETLWYMSAALITRLHKLMEHD